MIRENSFGLKFFLLIPVLLILFTAFSIVIINSNFASLPNLTKEIFNNPIVQGFTTIFLSIILEALPFIILGTIISSLIQVFVSEETIEKIIPKNKILGTLCAASIGLIFPVCDCAIVPIARRLLKKGMPLYIVLTFMLSVPIVNPVVLASTYYAFSNNTHIMIVRAALGMICAMIIGNILGYLENSKTVLKESKLKPIKLNRNFHVSQNECECGCGQVHHHDKKRSINTIITEIINHTTIELHDVGKFIILGAFLSAFMQTIISRKYILFIGQNKIISVIVMMLLAFMLAICSETDAFIARSFVGQFTSGSIIAFLIFGPMIDIKNALMLSGTFNSKFVVKLILLIFILCLSIGILLNLFMLKGGYLWLGLIKVSLSGL